MFRTWSRFAAPRATACSGPSQLNAVLGGLENLTGANR